MHHHLDQEILIIDILSEIAQKKKKSLERVKQLLLINKNAAINRLFWSMLDEILPHHEYEYVGCCAECGSLALRTTPPHSAIHIN